MSSRINHLLTQWCGAIQEAEKYKEWEEKHDKDEDEVPSDPVIDISIMPI